MEPRQHKMGRPPVSPEQKRDALMQFKVTKAERAEIIDAAHKAGKSVSALLLEAWRASQRTGRAWARCSTPGCKAKAVLTGLCRRCYMREAKRAARARGKDEQIGQISHNKPETKG